MALNKSLMALLAILCVILSSGAVNADVGLGHAGIDSGRNGLFLPQDNSHAGELPLGDGNHYVDGKDINQDESKVSNDAGHDQSKEVKGNTNSNHADASNSHNAANSPNSSNSSNALNSTNSTNATGNTTHNVTNVTANTTAPQSHSLLAAGNPILWVLVVVVAGGGIWAIKRRK